MRIPASRVRTSCTSKVALISAKCLLSRNLMSASPSSASSSASSAKFCKKEGEGLEKLVSDGGVGVGVCTNFGGL